jgi:hypothetical protein
LEDIGRALIESGIVGGEFSVFRRGPSGKVDAYLDYTSNPQNPQGLQAGNRFRRAGDPHGGVPAPLIVQPNGRARTASPGETPP